MTSSPDDHARRRFDEHWSQVGRDSTDPGEQRRLRTLVELCPTVDSLLEVGCGSGAVLAALGARAHRRYGCDSSQSGVSAAAQRPGLLLIQAAANRLPFADRSIELVASCDVLEHLPDAVAAEAVAELARVASRYVLLNVPLREDRGWSELRCPACRHIYHRDHHQRSYDPQAVASLLPSDQFARLRSATTGGVVRHPLPLPAGFGAWLGLGHRPAARCEHCGASPGPQPTWQRRLAASFVFLHNAATRPLRRLVSRDTELVMLFARRD